MFLGLYKIAIIPEKSHQTCGVRVVVATKAPSAALSARTLLEPVVSEKYEKKRRETTQSHEYPGTLSAS